ncbi:MAG: XdhC family protein [Deltaproteobacteria bacterium]|nr:XdhC family protein [Deltaproteobacteria bacterium]
MIVNRDGSISGTIGGGGVEAHAIKSALGLFGSGGAVLSSYNLTQSAVTHDLDLVCGGKMRVLSEHIPASDENIKLFSIMTREIEMAKPFYWVGKFSDKGEGFKVDRLVRTADRKWHGQIENGHMLDALLEGNDSKKSDTVLVEESESRLLISAITPPRSLYIMGAGHVSKEIELFARRVGFKTIVIDDRPEFANPERFPQAAEVHVCRDFSKVFDQFKVNAGSYIAIVTRGHRFDKEVLAQALRTGASYIGMIGSRKKRDYVYRALLSEGFTQSDIDRVHCPIGLPLNVETPAEIAVSIVAELIEHRAEQKASA